MTLHLTSAAFAAGHPIPNRYTCDGPDISPPLAWDGAPAGTRSFALICSDPDAPGRTWYHWALYDIPAVQTELPENFPPEGRTVSKLGINDFGQLKYGGPCPPRGRGEHHYHFTLLALDVPSLGIKAPARCRDIEHAARGHVLAATELVGLFGH